MVEQEDLQLQRNVEHYRLYVAGDKLSLENTRIFSQEFASEAYSMCQSGSKSRRNY